MIVYFIRHGHPEYPMDESGRSLVYGPEARLSIEGWQRIHKVAQAILQRENRRMDRLISSPHLRAKETARLIAEVMHLNSAPILEDPRLRDTDSTWPGEPMHAFLKTWDERRVFDDPHILETLDELRARMTSAVDDHLKKFHGEMIGFIGHGDPFRAWLFSHDKPFLSYENLVKSTFENAERIRVTINEDGQMESEIVHDFCEWSI